MAFVRLTVFPNSAMATTTQKIQRTNENLKETIVETRKTQDDSTLYLPSCMILLKYFK